MTTDAWGVDDRYIDAAGAWHETSATTRTALRAAMGIEDPGTSRPSAATVRVVRAGEAAPIKGRAELTLEDGSCLRVDGLLPPDLPLGYHRLELFDVGESVLRLIVAPPRCHLPVNLRTWAWVVQLYAMRSTSSWGIGDLGDLRDLARWSAAELHAGMLLVNPLHAGAPVLPQEPSPYYPTSRCFRNPLYLRVEDVPGAASLGLDLERLSALGRALDSRRLIDRDAVFRVKREALERIWSRTKDSLPAAYDAYERQLKEGLIPFATYCVLAETEGGDWRRWPLAYRRCNTEAVRQLSNERLDRRRFHCWLQWLLDEQLAAAAAELPLMQDLAIGADPGGADAWMWQDVVAANVSVGAPPDLHNSDGQNWGFPPFAPQRLRAAGYDPFIRTIRATLRHARGLRIDHVMGLFRLFWIPAGANSQEGAYVRYPADDLLAIVALESHRASAIVVGEDLGTVEDGVRERLHDSGILSYRLLWFETDPPDQYPEQAFAAVTTHDLPTIAGVWSGADSRGQRAAGCPPSETLTRSILARLRAMVGASDDLPVERVIERVYGLLARSRCHFVAATLEDALAVEERPNMPGKNSWPSWSLALPATLEELMCRPLVRTLAKTLAER